MSAPAPTDLSGLARLAQISGAEIRPLLLRVQAASFASAPHRDRDSVRRFEALALGLIPLVTSDVLAEVAALLRAVPETPPAVREGLAERLMLAAADPAPDQACRQAAQPGLAPAEIDALVRLDSGEVDLALAGNRHVVIDGAAWHRLVRRGQGRPRLATRLLDRPEAGALDRAALYRFADAATRDLVRQEGAASVASPAPGATVCRRAVLAAAEIGDAAGLHLLLETALAGRGPVALDLDRAQDRDLLVLALLALGLEPDDCIRVTLTLDDRLSRSIPIVFRLAEVARSTPRSVAARILDQVWPGPERPDANARSAATVEGPSTPRRGRPAPPRPDRISAALPVAPRRDRALSAPGDRRSRATTGPGRT